MDTTANIRVALIALTHPTGGGAHQYERSVILNVTASKAESSEFVIFCPKELESDFRKQFPKLTIQTYRHGLLTLFFLNSRHSLAGYAILKKVGLRYGSLEKQMRKCEVDIAYFVSPNPLSLDLVDIPMINTVWELGHRSMPEFIEITGDRHYEERELYFRSVLPKSFRIMVDTEHTAKRIEQVYGVLPERVRNIGLIFTHQLEKTLELPYMDTTDFGSQYLIYPAQFWPHKRHVLLIRAFFQATKSRSDVHLVLTGGDKGNESHIRAEVERLGISNRVHFLGFVNAIELQSLICGARALVFPSALGPSNLPPLEAALLGTPSLIGSVHHDPALINDYITVVESGSVDAWTAAIQDLLTKPKPARIETLIKYENVGLVVQEIINDFRELRSEWKR